MLTYALVMKKVFLTISEAKVRASSEYCSASIGLVKDSDFPNLPDMTEH